MHDRGIFWPAVPEWQSAAFENSRLRIQSVGSINAIWLVSGDLEAFQHHHGELQILGPRDVSSGPTYRLRLAPDRLLNVSEVLVEIEFGWSGAGYAVTDITDGLIVLDISGPACLPVMEQGCGYDFAATSALPLESTTMLFAGMRAMVSRRQAGWRLHVERPMAAALWRWLTLSGE